jgi:hypothetical protein
MYIQNPGQFLHYDHSLRTSFASTAKENPGRKLLILGKSFYSTVPGIFV